jgi:murein DD-endopeptidase MepM/ murein hydrolase activator NlpD/uncharacterized protein YgiM (DUF1202 family)
MPFIKTKFSSDQQGFHFINSFHLDLPVKFQLPFGSQVDLSKVVFGLCGGMCFTALDYFNLGMLPLQAEDVKNIDRKLFVYLCERQLDSLKIPTLLKLFDWMMMEDRTLTTNLLRYEIPKLRRMLDKGYPAVLALLRTKGLDDPTQNHQVLATGYESDLGARKYLITLYDPNHPHQEPHIRVDYSDTKTGLRIEQSTGEPLRGFFVIPYTARDTPPRPKPGLAAFDLAGGVPSFQLNWPVDSRRVNQGFGENPDTYKPFGLPGHEGIDLFAPTGANVYAAANGEVTDTGHPQGHPYGLQIRLKHAAGDQSFHTIYAHLSQSLVTKGQRVNTGDLIGLADNTGNSFGSHLHLTLKIDGAKTPGYPAGIVDPWPYLNNSIPDPDHPLPPESGLLVYTSMEMNLRAGPDINFPVIALLPAGEALSLLGDAEQLKPKIGVQGEWFQVKTIPGTAGYVAAWLVQDNLQAFPPTNMVIYPYDQVNLRSGPGTAFSLMDTLTMNDPLTVLGDRDLAETKLGKQEEWIQVQTEKGNRGFVAAWLVHTTGQTAPSTGLVVYPTVVLNVRARPSMDGNPITVVSTQDELVVLGDKEQALASIGQQEQWLNVRTPGDYVGYVAAWLVQLPGDLPPQPPTDLHELLVYPSDEINIRAQPAMNAPRTGGAHLNEALQVVEADLNAAKGKIGKADLWIFVERKNDIRGWVAAWLVRATPS